MKIVHVMSDGTVRDSIEGLVVPAGHPVYRVIAGIEKSRAERKKSEDKEKGA